MAADELDPLYDPAWLILLLSAWCGATWFIGPVVGLAVLVVGGLGLLAAGVRYSLDHPTGVPLHADLSVMLVFCATGLALPTLVLVGLTTHAPATLLGGAAGAVLIWSLADR